MTKLGQDIKRALISQVWNPSLMNCKLIIKKSQGGKCPDNVIGYSHRTVYDKFHELSFLIDKINAIINEFIYLSEKSAKDYEPKDDNELNELKNDVN